MTDLAEPPQRARPGVALHTQIFIALVCAVVVGTLTSKLGLTAAVVPVVELLGQLFLRLLKMLVVPLIFSTRRPAQSTPWPYCQRSPGSKA